MRLVRIGRARVTSKTHADACHVVVAHFAIADGDAKVEVGLRKVVEACDARVSRHHLAERMRVGDRVECTEPPWPSARVWPKLASSWSSPSSSFAPTRYSVVPPVKPWPKMRCTAPVMTMGPCV